MTAATTDLRSLSLWWDQVDAPSPRPPLAAAADVDVAVVGAGYTGLWTAHSLLAADPTLRVLVVERRRVGFGASGRNGGWCVGELAGGLHAVDPGDEGARRQWKAIADTVAEVGHVVTDEAIECGFVVGGAVRLARTRPQLERQRAEIEHARALGLDDLVVPLTADEARSRLAASRVVGGLSYTAAARLHPVRLALGLAAAVERRGATIVESTAATAIEPGGGGRRPVVRTDRGDVRADVVVDATEAYGCEQPGARRRILPLYSLMVATEPLDPARWDEIGLADRATFADDRRTVIYGQRTTDDRIAFGGRGARYGFGSRIDPAIERHSPTHERIESTLRDLLPQLGRADDEDDAVRITHRWGGVLGVPRTWRPTVALDRRTGIARAGGYVGEGVAAANLAGRTLAQLVVGDGELLDLPWIADAGRRWEPEPFRWLGVNAGLALAERADRSEERRDAPSRLGAVVDHLLG